MDSQPVIGNPPHHPTLFLSKKRREVILVFEDGRRRKLTLKHFLEIFENCITIADVLSSAVCDEGNPDIVIPFPFVHKTFENYLLCGLDSLFISVEYNPDFLKFLLFIGHPSFCNLEKSKSFAKNAVSKKSYIRLSELISLIGIKQVMKFCMYDNEIIIMYQSALDLYKIDGCIDNLVFLCENFFLLRYLCQKNNCETVEKLLKDGRVNPSANNNLAIFMAATKGHDTIVDLLLKDTRVNLLATDKALYGAVVNGHYNIVSLFLQNEHIMKTTTNNVIYNLMNPADRYPHIMDLLEKYIKEE